MEDIAAGGTGFQLQKRAHASQHGRVETVGLGELAGCFGEAPRLARVHFDERQAGKARVRSNAR